MKSNFKTAQLAYCALITMIALIAMAAAIWFPLKWPYPVAPLPKAIALGALITGNVAACLACILAIVLCWRRPESGPARNLSAFLVLLVLFCALSTKVLGSVFPAAWEAQRAASVVGLGVSILAAFAWIRFCRGFPREFSAAELPAYYMSAEPLGLFSPQRSSRSVQGSSRLERILLQKGFLGRDPSRYIDSAYAEWFVLLAGGAYFFFAALRLLFTGFESEVYLPPWVVFMLVGLGTDMLRQHYYLSRDAERHKILWVVEGTLAGFTLIPLAGFMAATGLAFSPWRDDAPVVIVLGLTLGFMCFVVCAVVGIFKEGAIDPALVIKKTALLTIMTAFILVSYLLFVGGVGSLVMRFTAVQSQSVIVFSTLAIAMLFQPMRTRAQVFVNRRLFRKKYEYPELLETIKREIDDVRNSLINLDDFAERIKGILASDNVVVFIKSAQSGTFSVAGSAGAVNGIEGLSFGADSGLANLAEPCHGAHQMLADGDRRKLMEISCMLLVPAVWSGRAVGVLSLGPRRAGGEYDLEDTEFLSAVMNHLGSGLTRQEIEKEKRDLDQAREIQQAFLPREIPALAGYDISGVWLPARTVSGDYYDVFKLGESKIAICIGDVSGKGMPAALLMANVQAAVRSLASDGLSPSELCRKVNDVIHGSVAPGRFITFFYSVIDTTTNRIVYTCAGHNPPILLRHDGGHIHLDAGGMVLGLFADGAYAEKEVELAADDRIILFTDGISEAASAAGEEYGEQRLIEVAKGHSGAATELQQTIIGAVSEHCAGNFHDDVTLVIVRVSRNI